MKNTLRRNLISVTGIMGAFLFIIASILGGLWIDGYSFVDQYISESFATGIPNAEYLRYMYIASGILMLIFGFAAPSFFTKSKGIAIGFYVFAILYGLGNITVAVFPCDVGCPTEIEDSSLAQIIHNTSAFLTYAIVPFCLMGIGFSVKKVGNNRNLAIVSTLCGLLALIFVLILFGDAKGSFIGVFQRIVEGSILFWVMYTALYISKTTTAHN